MGKPTFELEPTVDEKKAYWNEKLRGVNSTSFPAVATWNTSGPQASTVHGSAVIQEGAGKTIAALDALVLASWALTVSTYMADSDVYFGVIAAHFSCSSQSVLMPRRLAIDGGMSTSQLLAHVRHESEYSNRFNMKIDDIASISHDTRRACQFGSVIALPSSPSPAGSVRHAAGQDALLVTCAPQDPSKQQLQQQQQQRCLEVTLCSNVDAMFARRVLNTLTHVLGILSSHTTSSAPLSGLRIVTPSDQAELLAQARAQLPRRVSQLAHDLIAVQTARHPGHTAVDAWDGALTYERLDALSARVARCLQARGVGRETAVPVLFEKSRWAVVAMLGVWKAGAFYVPLDAGHPLQRLQAQVRELGAALVLCSGAHRATAEMAGCEVLVVGMQEEEVLADDAPAPAADAALAEPGNLAYTIYTSGSTGTPKGVMVEHAALSSALVAIGEHLKLDAGSRVLQLSAFTFDVSVFEMFCTLAFGGCVCLPSEDQKMNDLAGFIEAFGVHLVVFTPSLARSIAPESVPTLRTVILGGEPMLPSDKDRWCRPNVPLRNAYGPTETTIACSLHETTASTQADTIGSSGLGCRFWVVNHINANELSPIGAIGELCVEGPNVARGYLNDMDKTAGAFSERPAWLAPDEPAYRAYRTGDLVCYRPDGTLRYVGRKDAQVKVRGQRVELGEIEDAIRKHLPGPTAAVAVELIQPSGMSRKLLVAGLALGDAFQGLDHPETRQAMLVLSSALRPRLEKTLPGHMIPEGYIPLPQLPMNSSGKLDRRALRDELSSLSLDGILSFSTSPRAENESQAESDIEALLRDACSFILNVAPSTVTLEKSFAEVGGDSITAMQVAAKLRATQKSIKVVDLLRSPSLRDAAAAVRDLAQEAPTLLREELAGKPFALSPIQRVFMDFARAPQDWNHYHQSMLMRLTVRKSAAELDRAVAWLVERHSMLRARFSRAPSGQWTQHVDPSPAIPYILNMHGPVTSVHERAAIMQQSRKSLDIEQGPLMRIDVFDHPDDAGSQLLFIVIHHLVVDLVSWRIIISELQQAFTTGFPELDRPFAFQAWAELQERRCHDAALGGPEAALPIAVPPPDLAFWGMDGMSNLHGAVRKATFALAPQLTRSVLQEHHGPLRTEPIDLLLAALFLSFRQTFPEREAPTIINESHGREAWDESIDLTRTVGWFTTMYPLHVAGIRPDDVTDAVRRIKDVRRSIPSNGWQYFSSRSLTAAGRERFQHDLPAEVAFNHEGSYQLVERAQSVLLPERWTAGEALADASPTLPRFNLFEISSTVLAERLQFTFVWHPAMRYQDRIADWMAAIPDTLERICAALAAEPGQLTRSDVPQMDVDYPALVALSRSILAVPGITGLDAIEDVYPCSPIQESLGISLARFKDVYEVEITWDVQTATGKPVEPQRLEKAWAQAVARHPALRTIFVESVRPDAMFDQVVLKRYAPECLRLHAEDAAALALNHPRRRGKDDLRRPAHRMLICSGDDGRTFCRLEVTHLVSDGMSILPLLRDISLAYEGRLETRNGPRYADFVRYVRDEQRRKDSIAYWMEYLRGAEPCVFPVMTDSIPESNEQRETAVRLDVSYSQMLAVVSQAGLTLPTLFQMVWALTLQRYTSRDEVVFGDLASGRDAPIPGIHDAVGPFIGMLVHRVDLSTDAPALETMRRIQAEALQGADKQASSLADMHHALGLADAALFNTGTSFQALLGEQTQRGSALTFTEAARRDPTEYDVSLIVETGEQNARVSLYYRSAVLSDGAAANIANTVNHLLTELLRDPARPPSSIAALSPEDLAAIWRWNAQLIAPVDECAHHFVERSMRAHPQRAAVYSWDGELTYGELDRLSRRVAEHLVGVGVVPDSIVPLCFEKSMWAIVAMLGVLRAGGCFVMLDPAHPDSRVLAIVDEVSAPVVLASAQEAARMQQAGRPVCAVTPDFVYGLRERSAAGPVCASVTPDHAMYVIFTSGTTGVPKGSVISHRAYCTGFREHAHAIQVSAASRTLQFSAYSFDASVGEILTTLQVGGCICTPSEADRLDIVPFIARSRATWAGWTPSFASLIDPQAVPTLEVLLMAGEPLPWAQVDAWVDRLKLLNIYGPSECSVACVVNPHVTRSTSAANIGRGYRACTWIVDEHDHTRLRPVGVVGELLIEGPVLARGYLNQPAKTRDVFIDAPAWLHARPASRLYKTGDLVRYSADGSINFVGRKDTQLKINGQRVEVGDVEQHLRDSLSQPAPPLAVELLKHQDLLAAFIVVGPTDEPDDAIIARGPRALAALRTLVPRMGDARLALPAHMMPRAFVPLTTLPITTAGKLDRRALQRATAALSRDELVSFGAGAARADAQVEGRTRQECALLDLWKQALQVGVVGVNDNFFRLGGDSLRAIRLSAMARRRGLNLSVADIFMHPVLADMATAVPVDDGDDSEDGAAASSAGVAPFSLLAAFEPPDKLRAAVADECCVPVDAIEDIFPCTPLQEALMAISARPHYAQAYTMHAPFRLPADLDELRFRAAWAATCAAHPTLRARIVLRPQGALLVTTCSPVPIATETVPLERYLQQQQRTPFEYGQPLLRMAIVGGGGGAADADRFFVLSAHHACYDGWSQRLVWEDVARAYNGSGVAPAQPFQSFVRKIKLSPREASESFWRDALADRADDDDDNSAVTFPAVPAGHRPVAREKLSHRCRRLPQKPAHLPGVTVSTLLNAAWAIVLAQYGGVSTVSFGATVSGREVALPGIEGIVGPTISTVPRKVMVRGEQSVEDFLQYVRAAIVVASISHAHLALDHIMRLSPAARRACNFGSLLTVQPRSAVLGSAHEAIGLQALPVDSSSFHPHPLAVDCWVGAGEDEGMELELHFDPDCISADVVGGMARQLDHVLQNLCAAEPSAPVKSAMALHAEDLSRLLAWADRVPAPVEACAHHAIEANAAQHPHREALVTSERVWTYAELDRQATQLARRLVNTGLVGSDRFVGVCFEKTGFAVVAMLAVWKAGGAYVPLNPAHPVPRLRSLLGRAGARLVLCSSAAHPALEDAESYVAIRVDEACFRESADEDQSISLPVSRAGHAAYMIFTSGSTGEPKGVVMEHRALCSSMAAMNATVPLGPGVRMLQYASFTFDVSIQELILTLTAGACVCMPSDSERANDVAAFVRATGVNAINLTPSVLRLLRPADVPAVRLVICGGEALAQSDVETWASVPGLQLVNEYGPTEVCISITRMTMAPGTKANIIGKPTAALPWVVSPVSGSLAAIGAVGELYLQGSTLARGYHGDPERTAEAFLLDPAWLPAGFGGRVYRTGDMVCRNGDGTLTFLGRRDGQVKIRGQRVETGEVAERVRKCMAEVYSDQDGSLSFSNAAVELYRPADDSGREPFLVALLSIDGLAEDQTGNGLVVMHSSKDVRLVAAAESIKQALRSVLPAYMVPPAFIAIRTLPITPSGKLNRRLIHDLLEELERRGSPLLGARTDGKGETRKLSEEEEALRQGWAEILGLDVEAISLGDGFFDLGGSSVTAIRLVSMMRSRGLGLKYEAIVTTQRLDEMALCIAPLRGGRDELPVPRPFKLLPPGQHDQVVRELLPRYGIDAALVQDVYPCTPLQEGLIAATVRDREAYVSFHAIQVPSSNKAKLEEAWHAVTNRFELLRTRIVPGLDNGSALQVVMQPQGIPPRWFHVPDVPDFISDVYATPCHGGQLVHTAWIKPVDGESPVIRAVIATHHALYDGWSMNMIWQALAAELEGNPVPAPTPYSAFVGHVTQQEDKAAVRHWRARLAGADCPPFPHNPPPAGYQPAASSTQETCVELGLRAGAGMASLARAAWGLVLAHYTGSADVVFGSIVSGRENGLQAVGGPTMAAVPVRVRLDSIDAGATVDTLLSRVTSEAGEDIPFAQIGMHRIARISSDARRACGFETLLVVQPPDSEEQESMVRPEPLSRPRIFPHAVIIEVAPSSDAQRAALSLAYDPLLLPDALAGRVLDTFAALLARLSDPANGRLRQAALPAISPRDLTDLRESIRASPIVTVDSCAHDLLRGPTRCSPGATAIEAWDGSLSYEQVDMLSSSLAAHLVGLGVRPERAVPLIFDKSKWVPVAMLAVWKAGGYWVPLDAGWPLSRLRTVVAAVDPAVVLASSGNRSMAEAAVPSTPDCVVVVEDGAQSVCSAARTTVCHGQIASSSNLAYVMFTSGSTGTPKGVMIQHRALSSSIVALRVSHGIDSASRVLHSASYSFDASLCEIFVVLSVGGTVCIPSERARLDDLCGYIRTARVSHAFCTPSVSRLLDPDSLPDLRALFLGGEPMLDADKQRWCGRVFLTNGFGPTETCIACAMQPLTQPETSARSIGKSLQNCRLWVAASLHDQCDQLAPIGAIGELCVEGPSVAKGYLDDTEKTAAAMMPAPPADWIGDDDEGMVERFRVYRTGDLVRYDEHGCLRFVGRRDALQVKIRGQRLELGDVENAVRRILLDEGSGDNEWRGTGAAVDVFESARGTQMLLAVLAIGDAYQEVDARPHPHTVRLMRSLSTMLHSRLAALLPTHMLPGGYVPVKELPLNASGKLDRRALKAHISALSLNDLRTFSADPENDAIAAALPQSEEEMLMATLWRKVLGLADDAQLSCEDTFFRLGGDSILAMRLAAEARSHGFQLAVRDVFAQPTLGGAAGCMKRVREESKNKTVPAQQEDKKDGGDEVLKKVRDEYPGLALASQETAPCTPMQVAMVQKTHIVRFVFSMDHGFDPLRFQAAVERCATVLTILRTRIVESDGVLHQVVVSSAPPWRFAGGSLEEAMDEEASIQTSVGDPLIRFTVVGHGSHLIWTQHHATYDAWSMRLLLEHVARAYADPTYHPLEPLPFLAFARRLHGSGRDPSSAATFWSSYFADATPTPQLFGYASVSDPRLDTAASCKLRLSSQLLRSADFTPAEAVVAAWVLAVARFTRSRDITIGHLVNGRTGTSELFPDIESTVGPTINTVPLRVQLGADEAKQLHQPHGLHAGCSPLMQQAATLVHARLLSLASPRQLDGLEAVRRAYPAAAACLPSFFPLSLNVHTGGSQSEATLGSAGRALGLRHQEARAVKPPSGGFTVEATVLGVPGGRGDGIGPADSVEMVAYWDERAVKGGRDEVEEILRFVGEVLGCEQVEMQR